MSVFNKHGLLWILFQTVHFSQYLIWIYKTNLYKIYLEPKINIKHFNCIKLVVFHMLIVFALRTKQCHKPLCSSEHSVQDVENTQVSNGTYGPC